MTVGLVRNAALGMVAIVGLGLAGCDDNPTDFEAEDTVSIQTNPSVMTVPAGVTLLLESRTENAGREATWEEITATVDASCGAGTVVIAEAASFEPTIQPPGQFDVTGGTTWGETCIQLSGGGADATVEVFVVADSLEITGAPANDELIIFQTVQLGANLLSSDGQAVGPFDPTTDLAWSSDASGVATVDGTGLVTAQGAGTATITATWTEFGVSVSASTVITVVVPPPVLTSTDVASADIGQIVTVTGTDLIPGAHTLFVDGFEVLDPILEATIVDETTATFRMPDGANGDVAVTIGVAGAESDPITVTRTGSTEPENNTADPLVAPSVSLPVDLWGFVDAGGDVDDFFELTLVAPTTLDMLLDWGTGADLDLLVVDGAFTAFQCGFVTATADQPESGQCALAPGTYLLWVNGFADSGHYHLQVSAAP